MKRGKLNAPKEFDYSFMMDQDEIIHSSMSMGMQSCPVLLKIGYSHPLPSTHPGGRSSLSWGGRRGDLHSACVEIGKCLVQSGAHCARVSSEEEVIVSACIATQQSMCFLHFMSSVKPKKYTRQVSGRRVKEQNVPNQVGSLFPFLGEGNHNWWPLVVALLTQAKGAKRAQDDCKEPFQRTEKSCYPCTQATLSWLSMSANKWVPITAEQRGGTEGCKISAKAVVSVTRSSWGSGTVFGCGHVELDSIVILVTTRSSSQLSSKIWHVVTFPRLRALWRCTCVLGSAGLLTWTQLSRPPIKLLFL